MRVDSITASSLRKIDFTRGMALLKGRKGLTHCRSTSEPMGYRMEDTSPQIVRP